MSLGAKVGGRLGFGDGSKQSMPGERLQKQGLEMRQPKYTTSIKTSQINTLKGKGSIIFHNVQNTSGASRTNDGQIDRCITS